MTTKRTKACRPIPIPHERGEIVLIEYDEVRGKPPMRVTVQKGDRYEHFRFVPSEHDGCVYIEEDGSGVVADGVELNGWAQRKPLRPIWYADGMVVKRWLLNRPANEGGRPEYTQVFDARDLAQLGMRRIGAPRTLDPFSGTTELDGGDSLVYCGICGDDMRDEAWNLCDHLFDTDSGVTGPGRDPLTSAAQIPEGLKTLVRRGGFARHLLSKLSNREGLHWSGDDITIFRPSGGFHRIDMDDVMEENGGRWDNDLRVGAGWLQALGAHTPRDNAIVCAWLREEIAAQDARRASGEGVYGVRAGWWQRGNLRAKRRTYAEAREIAARLRAKGERDVRVVRQVPKSVKRAA